MKRLKNNFLSFSVLMAAVLSTFSAYGATAQNSRSATAGNIAPARAAGRDVRRSATSDAVTERSTTNVSRAAATPTTGRAMPAVSNRNTARSTTNVSRAAASVNAARTATTTARTASVPVRTNVSRAASSRATAIFDDVNKIGGGYAQCREAYATCMDQFCAKANDTYRRCFCSDRFIDFSNTEDALSQATTLLQQFEDNNLNAVDKTAAEVDAMYSATVGEAAIKKDTSAAAKLLADIDDLLTGKKKQPVETNTALMTLDFSADIDDIWGGSSSISIFDSNSDVDYSTLQGGDLYARVHNQCVQMAADSCQSKAVANMAKSAYGIMITQDCNAYEKSIDAKREKVMATVRQAEKILRDARLEEYRAHNSADVNQCLDKVRSAILADTACGAGYARCLDNTGKYIDTNGEPIYKPYFFELANLIKLDGTDAQKDNASFDKFLEGRKMFAETALDSCRDISDLVWSEFKRVALIEIAQAQDEKIESVKSSCLDTMRECYDTQTKGIKSFDDATANYAGALGAAVARATCADRVNMCAALYSGGENCEFNANGSITNAKECGLSELLNFVDVVDTVRVAQGCETALNTFATELCTPESGDIGYPWRCRDLTSEQLKNQIVTRAALYCVNDKGERYTSAMYDSNQDNLNDQVTQKIKRLIEDIESSVADQSMSQCTALNGLWIEDKTLPAGAQFEGNFYTKFFGGTTTGKTERGTCVENSVRYACMTQNDITGGHGYATYNAATDTCVFTNEWYEYQCVNILSGDWENNVCYWDE